VSGKARLEGSVTGVTAATPEAMHGCTASGVRQDREKDRSGYVAKISKDTVMRGLFAPERILIVRSVVAR
jgi:hypothetical protein